MRKSVLILSGSALRGADRGSEAAWSRTADREGRGGAWGERGDRRDGSDPLSAAAARHAAGRSRRAHVGGGRRGHRRVAAFPRAAGRQANREFGRRGRRVGGPQVPPRRTGEDRPRLANGLRARHRSTRSNRAGPGDSGRGRTHDGRSIPMLVVWGWRVRIGPAPPIAAERGSDAVVRPVQYLQVSGPEGGSACRTRFGRSVDPGSVHAGTPGPPWRTGGSGPSRDRFGGAARRGGTSKAAPRPPDGRHRQPPAPDRMRCASGRHRDPNSSTRREVRPS